MLRERLRVAPAPTESLHVGVARTAVYNWLLARRTGGTLLLRIDDTVAASGEAPPPELLVDELRWLGIEWDEGPRLQSAGVARHTELVGSLLDEGLAYRDFAPPPKLIGPGRVYRSAEGRVLPSDESRRRAEAGEPHWVRLRVDPEGPDLAFEDAVVGRKGAARRRVEDFALLRADGSATYHLATVADDVHDEITLVMRGLEHVPSTLRQLLLYEALGAPPPRFAHLPMIEGRRAAPNGDLPLTGVDGYRGDGILPSAMRNYLALLGWSPPHGRELFLEDEDLWTAFDLSRVARTPCRLDSEMLTTLAERHIRELPVAEVVPHVLAELGRQGQPSPWAGHAEAEEMLRRAVDLARADARTVPDVLRRCCGLLGDGHLVEEELLDDICRQVPLRAILDDLIATVEQSPPQGWRELQDRVAPVAATRRLETRTVMFVLRVALTGAERGPPLARILELLGAERAVARLEALSRRCRG